MTRIDQITADVLAGSPETHIAILAREVARLREARAVVVPDLTAEEREDIFPAPDLAENEQQYREFWRVFDKAFAVAASRARAIPADRVPGDGMVAVDREALERLKRIETCARDFQERQRNLTISQDSYGFFQADNALESALRANQGGAAHD